jgi:molybdopterin adenylyltransferase
MILGTSIWILETNNPWLLTRGVSTVAIQAALFTIGNRYSSEGIKDEGGDVLEAICRKMGWDLVARQVLGDSEQDLSQHLIQTADSGTVDVIFTVDGIGIQSKDQVPEAMYHVCEKWIPGFPELIRARAFEKTPGIALTRGVAGIRGKTLIVNLPGTPTAIKDSMDVLKPVLRLVVEQIKGTAV